jgi:hypothetical protein
LHVINLQKRIGNPSPLSSSTDSIESKHNEESDCDRNNIEEQLSIAKMQKSSDSDIRSDEDSDDGSRDSNNPEYESDDSRDSNDSEYESDSSESSDACEIVEVENLRALRDDNENRNAYILRELKKWAIKGVSCKKIDTLLKILQITQVYKVFIT